MEWKVGTEKYAPDTWPDRIGFFLRFTTLASLIKTADILRTSSNHQLNSQSYLSIF